VVTADTSAQKAEFCAKPSTKTRIPTFTPEVTQSVVDAANLKTPDVTVIDTSVLFATLTGAPSLNATSTFLPDSLTAIAISFFPFKEKGGTKAALS
jgi:hypothetical protein